MPHKAYDPKKLHDHIVRIPFLGVNKYGSRTEWGVDEWHHRVMEMEPKEIIALRGLRGKVSEDNRHVLERYMGIGIREFPIHSGQIFSDEGKRNLIAASKAIVQNAREKKRTGITCNMGYRRTAAAIYMAHRRMGASHEEALEYSRGGSSVEPFSESERDQLNQLYEDREKYEGKK
jgi:hypothetical protein